MLDVQTAQLRTYSREVFTPCDMGLHWAKAWKCDLCGHTWLAVSSEPPQQCPKCRKRHWHDGEDHTTLQPRGGCENAAALEQSCTAGAAVPAKPRFERKTCPECRGCPPDITRCSDPRFWKPCKTCANLGYIIED
jgi:hypothetical protein